jgi:hypothetical protein
MRRRVLAVALSAATLVGAGSAVSAHDFHANANVILEYHHSEGGWFSGNVTSLEDFCHRFRKIVLRKRGPDGSVVIAKTRTDKNGVYVVDTKKTKGPYYTVARRKVKDQGSHKHVCKTAISNEVGQQTW